MAASKYWAEIPRCILSFWENLPSTGRNAKSTVRSLTALRPFLIDHAEPLGYGDRLGQRARAELLHDAVAMCLDGSLCCAELICDLLVALAAHDELEDDRLPFSEARHERLQLDGPLMLG